MDKISDLFKPILRASWYAFCLAACVALGLPTTTWRPESPENVLIDMAARQLEILSVAAIEAYRGMFLRYARGDWLTILAEETYETPRLQATFSSCLGNLENNSANTYNVPAGDVLAVQKNGIDTPYVIDGPLNITPGLLTGLTIRCLVAGSVGNAAVGEISQVTGQTFAGLTVTNTSEATARDVELDRDLAPRARLATGPTSPGGPDAAYEYIARGGDLNGTVDEEIAALGVTRVKLVVNAATGAITAYYATASGGLSAPSVAKINQKLLEKAVPQGIAFQGFSATPIQVDVLYDVRVLESENVSEQEVDDAIQEALTDFFQTVPIGGYPYVPDVPGEGELTTNKIIPVLAQVTISDRRPIYYAGGSLSPGSTSVALLDSQVAVLGTVAGTVTFTS